MVPAKLLARTGAMTQQAGRVGENRALGDEQVLGLLFLEIWRRSRRQMDFGQYLC